MDEGAKDGSEEIEGCSLGAVDGTEEGMLDGTEEIEGASEGIDEGMVLGDELGCLDGKDEGAELGCSEGIDDGCPVGQRLTLGNSEGCKSLVSCRRCV